MMAHDGCPTMVLVDPCLIAPGSHPHQYAASLLGAARERGMRCLLVCRQGSGLAAETAGAFEVLPLLRFPGASKLTAFAELDRLDDRGRPRLQLPWTALRRARQRAARIAAFATDVGPVVARLRPGDHVLVATASELDCLGLARAIASRRPPLGIGWHLQFHGPLLPGPLPPGADTAGAGDARLGRVRRILAEAIAAASPHPLRFHCPTEELAAEWRCAGAEGASLLPFCITMSAAPPPASTDRRLRLAALGDARAEKNSQSIAAVVESTAADRDLAGRVRFACQTNPGFDIRSRRPADVAVGRAIAILQARDGDLVDCLPGPLEADAYWRQIELADALLLPYDQRRYRQRCSAILLEGVAAARVPIVTAGGWMARQLMPAIRAHADVIGQRHALATDPGWEVIPLSGARSGGVRVAIPDAADSILIEGVWRETGDAALLAPAARIGIARAGGVSSAILQADPRGAPVPVVIRLPPTTIPSEPRGPAMITVTPAMPGHPPGLATLRIRWLRGGGAMATGAGGIVVPGAEELGEGIREFVAHADHYLRTAAALAPSVRSTHAPESVLEMLLA